MAVAFDIFGAAGASVFGAGSEHKSDPYGSGQTSPIPNPTNNPRGEPIPAPGLPDKYPSYLKPIPVNTRDVEKVMRGHLSSEEPKVRRFLYSTWTAERDAIKYQEIRNAIRDGEFSEEFLARFQQSHAQMVNEKLAPKWEAAMEKSAAHMGEAIESKFGTFPRFDAGSKRVREWIEARGGELAVNLSKQQHEALKHILKHHTIQQPTSARELGRLIRSSVGLTEKQAKAVSRFRDSLVEAGELSRKQIEHQVQNYAGRLHRIRAERIARTELSWAFNQGGFEQMRQTVDAGGALEGAIVVKEWATGDSEKVCDHCGPLDGQTVGLEETYPGATKRVPNSYTPPAHPGCRCTIIYVVLSED